MVRIARMAQAAVLALAVALPVAACTSVPPPTSSAPATRAIPGATTPPSSAVTGTSVAPAATGPLPTGAKGYELYSWSVGGEWHYTLAVGTNRTKTAAELKNRPSDPSTDRGMVDVRGVDALAALLARLPAGQGILWMGSAQGRTSEFALPPPATVDDVRRRAGDLGLGLVVAS